VKKKVKEGTESEIKPKKEKKESETSDATDELA